MIRVLHYGMSPNLGGIETYLLNLARTIDSSRYRFDFVYSDYGSLPVFAPDLPASRFFGVTPRRVSPRRNQRDLDDLFTQEQFDILHFHANTASYVAPVRAALRHGVRVIYHSHNAGASRSRITRALHLWNRNTLPWRSITKVAVSSEAGRWMFGSHSFEVINNGIDVDAFAFDQAASATVRAELGIAEDALVLGSVAAFLPAKNHAFILRVFADVADRDPDARLILTGSGPLEPGIREQVRNLELSDRVLFLGHRPDVPALLSAMDRFLMPSLHEGFPLAAVEAQASGLPCLLSDTITPEVVATPFATRMALDEGPSAWAGAVLAGADPDRISGAKLLRDSTFTSHVACQRVVALYTAR